MSRSFLRDKFMRSLYSAKSLKKKNIRISLRIDMHPLDEKPKNRPSKFITSHMSADVHWLQESTSFGGHSIPKGGHRRVSGNDYSICSADDSLQYLKNKNSRCKKK